MANSGLTLTVNTPLTGTSVFIEDIAPVAVDYWHSIRTLGGYWMAGWTIREQDVAPRLYEAWRSGRQFHHFVEQYRGQTTWEGSIEEIQPDDAKRQIAVTAYGYVHSIQNKYNTTTDESTTDGGTWIEYLRANYTEFIQSGDIAANAVQVYKASDGKIWDEMKKVVE